VPFFILGVAIVAAVAAAGDFFWYHFGIRHRMTAGLVHGALLLTVVGGVLGHAAGHLLKGLPVGALAGLGGAISYYVLIALTGGRTYGAAIPAAWIILWLLLAVLDGRWIRLPRRSWNSVMTRGAVAALAGGASFALVMTSLWGRPSPAGRNYFLQWGLWMIAWAPGLAALMLDRSGSPRAGAEAGRTSATDSADSRVAGENQQSLSSQELMDRRARGDVLHVLDVRSEGEFAAGHVPGAVNVPFNQVGARLDEVPGTPGEELIVYCGHGPRAYMAAISLRHSGRRVVYLRGHWSGWQAQNLPIETGRY
jgi:rhodanese-related sulfurtransferase